MALTITCERVTPIITQRNFASGLIIVTCAENMNRSPDFKREEGGRNNLLNLQIPIGAAWAIFSTFAVGAVWTSWQLWDLKQSIKDGTGDRWRRTYQREWANRLQQQNTALRVPSVDQVAKDLD